MINKITSWLNSKNRPYSKGAALYVAYGSRLMIKHRLLQGDTPQNRLILIEELYKIIHTQNNPPIPNENITSSASPRPNPELAAAVRAVAHKTYKEMMNKRAVLFGLCRSEMWEDENSAERIKLRAGLALEILDFNKNIVTPAYDKLEHVEKHGQLPKEPVRNVDDEENDYMLLPDLKVKPTIDNIRKNLSKLRKREPTEDRLALIVRHEKNLKKLLIRWHSLK